MLLMLVPDDVLMEIAETCSTFRYLNKAFKNGCDGMFYLCIHSARDVSA